MSMGGEREIGLPTTMTEAILEFEGPANLGQKESEVGTETSKWAEEEGKKIA